MAFETDGDGKAVSLLADGRAGQIDSKRSSRVALQVCDLVELRSGRQMKRGI